MKQPLIKDIYAEFSFYHFSKFTAKQKYKTK